MANFFTLTLDTTGPSNPLISLAGGATYATEKLLQATISTGDSVTTGYQMKIWGDVDISYDPNVQATEGASVWITYATSKQISLSSGDGSKNIYLKIRDDVNNESAQATDVIILDSTIPEVMITGPDVTRVSKKAGKNVASFSFQVDSSFIEYKVKVGATTHDTGTLIGTANGSTNMSGTGTWTSASVINSTINGADLEIASAGDGAKTIKVFVKDASGLWSV